MIGGARIILRFYLAGGRYALGEPILCDMNWESTGVLHGRLVAGREVNRVDYFCSCRRAVLRAC